MTKKSLLISISILAIISWNACNVAAQDTPRGIEVEPSLLESINADESTGYIIYFSQRPDLSPASHMNWNERGWFVIRELQAAADQAQARVRSYLAAQRADYQSFWIDNVIVVKSSNRATLNGLMTFSEIAAIRSRRTASLIEPVEKNQESLAPMAIESNISHVNADDVWSMGINGSGMVVANIDTGVRYTHSALVSHYRGNLGGGSYDHNYNWLDPTSGYTVPYDDHGHGSHTMGITIGDDNGANQIGMAPGAKWIACDACNGFSGCPETSLLTCAQWIAAPYPIGNPGAADPDKRPHVVNNSWGDCGTSYDDWFQGSIDSWHAAGVYPVFSNGNSSNCGYPSPPGCNTVGNPARYGNVTGVGSTGQSNGQYATHSNWGPTDNPDAGNPNGYPMLKPQVLSPGVNIRSATNVSDSSFESWSGTSMSAPHVAGLVALMWQAAPCLLGNYAATETILQNTATPIPYASNCGGEGPGNIPNNATGWGEIDAFNAVNEAKEYCGAPGECTENDEGSLDITGANGNTGSQVVHTVRIQGAPNMVDALGFEVTYDTAALSYSGVYTRGNCVANFDFFDCTAPQSGVVRCGGFEGGTDVISQGADCDVVDLQFSVIEDPCDAGTCPGQQDLQALVDDITGWSTSHGCFCCGFECDVSGDSFCTPGDALCSFQVYLSICPTACGPCEDICCDVNGDGNCTPGDALCRFHEYLGIHPNCFDPF